MDGKSLTYTLARPEPTAGDIKEWIAKIFVDGHVAKEYTELIGVEAIDFKLPKGTKGVQVGVFFRDTSGKTSEVKYSETFDVIDNISPPAPGSVMLSIREETEEDADTELINVEPEPTPDPDPVVDEGEAPDTAPA